MASLVRLEARVRWAERRACKAWARREKAEARLKKLVEAAAKAEARLWRLREAGVEANRRETEANDALSWELRLASERAREVTTATIGRPGDAAATLHEESGIDYARCLVMCNCD
jgi:hypothetical protein